jgi:hypothetical protein
MNYRLLVDYTVIEFLETLPRGKQRQLRNRFVSIRDYPQKFSDYTEHDITGRQLDLHIFGEFAIKFWEDTADEHVKILDLHFADGHDRRKLK